VSSSVQPLISLTDVSRRFTKPLDVAEKVANLFGAGLKEQVVRAVDAVSFDVAEGEVVGLVGESGCGKSTLGRVIAGILDPSAGTVAFQGRDVTALSARERRAADLAIQMVFQDHMAALNPRKRVVEIIGEAPVVHGIVPASRIEAYVAEVMTTVGLDPATRHRHRPRARGEAEGSRLRRVDGRARRVDPGPGAQSVHRPAAGARPHLHLRQP
jgi:peptide/nickel transport system ATP-binding protein